MDRYEATVNMAETSTLNLNKIGGYCVKGPGPGIGVYEYFAAPNFQFHTMKEAEIVAAMMNIAFKEGMQEQKRRIKEILL